MKAPPFLSLTFAAMAVTHIVKLCRWIPPAGVMVRTRNGVSAYQAMTLGLVCLGMYAVESEAAVTFSNPLRSVTANNNKGSSLEIVSTDFGSFNESARVDWEEIWGEENFWNPDAPNTTGHYYSVSTQDSTVGLTGVSAKGSVNASGSDEFWGEAVHRQYSRSYFKVDFSIDSSSDIYLTGTVYCYVDMEGTNHDYAEITITLSDVGGVLFSRTIGWEDSISFPYNHPFEISESFTSLESGNYVFEVSAETDGDYRVGEDEPGVGGGGRVDYDITLVPEPSAMLLAGLAAVLLVRRKR